ncbi:ABC transporter b family member 20 [Phtheirospermum japonicum]|uniref:ABC transporter b family member 20 n=1 Tax=Phtheirospermum japonicum TaxID=374723 RepID=A0A830CSC2_9LAMI|nr:ABC transporter b family member 20 [Phtheirospermum japonicum]
MMISRGLFGWSPPHIQPLTPVSEVSEPPESPSPYMDMGTGEAEPVEVEDEMDAEGEEMEPPPAAVPFSRLFACADRLDWALMFVGSVAAAAHGTALVVYLHYFAKIVHLLRSQKSPMPDELFREFTQKIGEPEELTGDAKQQNQNVLFFCKSSCQRAFKGKND